jgi:membrane protein YqaA with SNARE-associated domain
MPSLLSWLSLPEVGLGAVFLISLLASTLLPLGSEPALLAYVALTPSAVWLAIGVATLGNTLGGVITYWMGAGAQRAFASRAQGDPARLGSSAESRAQALAQRFGAPVLLFSWLPLVGDPLCGVAGWMRLPFVPCLIYIALGKCARYALICGVLLHFFL